jgi:hypothetical protein
LLISSSGPLLSEATSATVNKDDKNERAQPMAKTNSHWVTYLVDYQYNNFTHGICIEKCNQLIEVNSSFFIMEKICFIVSMPI